MKPLAAANRNVDHDQNSQPGEDHDCLTRLLNEGHVVLLHLAPVDPRSLMQGDVANASPRDGALVLALGDRRIGTFERIDDGTPLAANELKMRYRMRE